MSELIQRPLSAFADVTMGQSPPAELCNAEGKGLPFLQGSAEFGRIHPHTDTFCQPPLRVAKAGSVLISVRAPVGSMNYANQDYCIGRGLGAFRAKPELSDTVFLKHAVELHSNFLYRRSQGSTFAAVSSSDVRAIPVPAFAVGTQRKIATILCAIDAAIEQTEALIEKYQQIKAGLMHDLFTRGVLPNGQLRPPREQAPELYQETAIGWIPREWGISSCGQCCSIDSGITLGPHRRPKNKARGYLRVANVYRDELRLEDIATLELFPGEEEKSLKRLDLLVVEGHANRAEIGRCAMVCDEAEGLLFQNHLFRLRVTGLNPMYALLWMNSHYSQRYWERVCATSSGLNTINSRMLKAMPFFVPNREEQDRIAAAAERAKDRIGIAKVELNKYRTQKLGLMQDLLTGKVPVKVDAGAPESVDA